MRVAWLQDMDIFAAGGGAEKSDRAVFEEGLRRGHKMDLRAPSAGPGEADLYVVSNCATWDSRILFGWLADKPYVAYLHDYVPLCRYRLFYPGALCATHPYAAQAKALVTRSLLNVFLSPLHRDAWARAVPEVLERQIHLHPSSIPTDAYAPPEAESRAPFVLGVGCLVPYKGRDRVLEYAVAHGDTQFVFAGGADLSRGDGTKWVMPPNARHLGRVPEGNLIELYRQASAFIHLPDAPQPFERTAAEAKLCGVRRFIVNGLVGARSYPEWSLPRDAYASWISGAAARWWDRVEQEA